MTLEEIIKNKIIKKNKLIGFDEFMNLALYHPKLGYYRSSKLNFNKHGDFITAPETSDLFGFSLASQCAQVLNSDHDILEFGAGSGVLAAQVLFALGRLGKLPKKYYILELSKSLRIKQLITLNKVVPELMERIVWLENLDISFSGVVIANEVLDAMPVKRLIYKKNSFVELGVDYKGGKFNNQQFVTIYKNDKIFLPNNFSEGYITEVNPLALAWVDTLFKVINSGLVLLIDYGMTSSEYFHSQRNEGTLCCYYKHTVHNNPFINIGKQDITAWVNFSHIAKQAKLSGFAVGGYATQAMFLISLGIYKYLEQEKNPAQYQSIASQIKRLLLPNAMGESFKILSLTKNLNIKLNGFKEQDLSYKL